MGEAYSKLRRQKMNEQVLERLLDWIMDGTLSMGDHLNAEKIAQQLGVSRMPVREAFTMLEQMGLAEAIPYVGFKLIQLDEKDVHEVYLMRQLLEPETAAIASQNIDADGIADLESIHREIQLEFTKQDPDPRALYTLNRDFHFTLYQYAKVDRLYDTITSLWNSLSFYKLIYSKSYITNKVASDDMIQTHGALIRMLREKTPTGIRDLLKKDLGYHTVDVPAAVSMIIHASEEP